MPTVQPIEAYRNQPVAGAVAVVCASLLFATVGALVKIVAAELSNEMVVFFRNLCTLMVILPWTIGRSGKNGIKTGCFHLHLFRSFAGLGAMYCFFYAIAHLQLSEAFLLSSTGPLFIPVIAYLWLREPASKRVRWAIGIGFSGVALILKPGLGIFKPEAIIGLGAGMLAALAMVTIRRMSRSEPTDRIVFYFTALATLISIVPLAWSWQAAPLKLWPLLLLIGVMAAFGQLLLTKGYSLAPAARIGPFSYANVFFATLIGWLFWGETLDAISWTGALLIIAAGIITSRRTAAHTLVGSTSTPNHS